MRVSCSKVSKRVVFDQLSRCGGTFNANSFDVCVVDVLNGVTRQVLLALVLGATIVNSEWLTKLLALPCDVDRVDASTIDEHVAACLFGNDVGSSSQNDAHATKLSTLKVPIPKKFAPTVDDPALVQIKID